MNRYHLVIFKVPSPSSLPEEQVAIVDTEFDADMTEAEMQAHGERHVTRATETLQDHADRSTGEAREDLAAWWAGQGFRGFHDTDRPDPEEVFLTGHEAGYMRGLA